jgi:hypothetical protein
LWAPRKVQPVTSTPDALWRLGFELSGRSAKSRSVVSLASIVQPSKVRSFQSW